MMSKQLCGRKPCHGFAGSRIDHAVRGAAFDGAHERVGDAD